MKTTSKFYYLLAPVLLAFLLLTSCHSEKKATKSSAVVRPESNYMPEASNSPNSKPPRKSKNTPKNSSSPELRETPIVSKYASILGVSKTDITNYKLYNFIDVWYGTPYKYAGRTQSGVDCSDFASLLLQNAYNTIISGSVVDIYKQCKPVKLSELKEGDLLFFKINSKSLSHMGVYLQNKKFVHASVHAGVVIDDMNEDYYKKYFWGAGRVR